MLPPERAHRAAITALRHGLVPTRGQSDPPALRTTLWGKTFPNPIGLAAGFDKNAEVVDAMLGLGFGFVEIGTVTPRPQPGNPRPRLFRLRADAALINRLGFNNDGLDAVADRLSLRLGRPGIVGANVGCNRDSDDPVADYAAGCARLAGLVDYLVVNVSSPNTPGLRDLQAVESLKALIAAVRDALSASPHGAPPLLVKIAPDLDESACEAIAATAVEAGVGGLVVSNTTTARPATLRSHRCDETGGLSGRPLFRPSTDLLAVMYRLTQGRVPLIGVGGVASGRDVYEKICAGASLVQLYTALVYEGPGLVARLKRDLASRLRKDGFPDAASAVGSASEARAC